MQKHREVVQDLTCQCGAEIIKGGRLTCPRCHQSVDMTSESDVKIDEKLRWKCQKCLEHGKKPRTLAIGDEIKCRFCPMKNSLIQKEETVEGIQKEKEALIPLIVKEAEEIAREISKFAYCVCADDSLRKLDIVWRCLDGIVAKEIFGSRFYQKKENHISLHTVIVWGLRPEKFTSRKAINTHNFDKGPYEVLLVPGFELSEGNRASLHIGFVDGDFCLWAYRINHESLKECFSKFSDKNQGISFLRSLWSSLAIGLREEIGKAEELIRDSLNEQPRNLLGTLEAIAQTED